LSSIGVGAGEGAAYDGVSFDRAAGNAFRSPVPYRNGNPRNGTPPASFSKRETLKKMKSHTPSTIAAPAALYVHGMEVPPGARWLFISGQIGVHPDGRP